jgi:hypothetical protein
MSTSQTKLKSYWNSPGGKHGTIIFLLVLGVLAYFIEPYLIKVVWNTVNFIIGASAVVVLWFIVTNRALRLRLITLWDLLMRMTTWHIFKIDPFIIAEDDIKFMEKERENMSDLSTQVGAQKEEIGSKLKDKQDTYNHLGQKGKVAERQGMNDELSDISLEMKDIQEYINALMPMYKDLAMADDFLAKAYKNTGRTVANAKRKLELSKDLYSSVTRTSRALGAVQRFFNGDPERNLMKEQAADMLRKDISMKLASMKKAVRISSEFMKSIDLEKATYQQEGIKMLENFDPDKVFELQLPNPTSAETIKVAGQVDTEYYSKLLDNVK